MRTRLLAAALLSLLTPACVGPSNPYDPDSDPSRQARARLEGRVVLVDPNVEPAQLDAEASALWLRLIDGDGEEVARRSGGDLDVKEGGASFTFTDLVPGERTLLVEELSGRFLGPQPGRLRRVPGATLATWASSASWPPCSPRGRVPARWPGRCAPPRA